MKARKQQILFKIPGTEISAITNNPKRFDVARYLLSDANNNVSTSLKLSHSAALLMSHGEDATAREIVNFCNVGKQYLGEEGFNKLKMEEIVQIVQE